MSSNRPRFFRNVRSPDGVFPAVIRPQSVITPLPQRQYEQKRSGQVCRHRHGEEGHADPGLAGVHPPRLHRVQAMAAASHAEEPLDAVADPALLLPTAFLGVNLLAVGIGDLARTPQRFSRKTDAAWLQPGAVRLGP